MISLTSGKRIAVVCGGEYNNRYIYIKKEEDQPDRTLEDEDIYDILDEDDLKQDRNKYKNLRTPDRIKLIKSLRLNIEPLDEHLVRNFQETREKVQEKLKHDFKLSAGQMIPLPDEKETERIYVAGKTGSGKSCFAAMYASEYKRIYPKRKIYIFTKHEKENAYKIVKHIEILPDDEILQEPIEIESLKNSLIIFDDCDNIQDKIIKQNVRKLIDDVLTTGRKYNISCITLNHLLTNYKETRSLLNESNKVVFFNSGAANYHINRYLKTYLGFEKDLIKKITALRSRWTLISLTPMPMYVLHEHGVFII